MEESALIVSQFKNLQVTIYGTHDEPLFKAKDIGKLLELTNIREVIKSFNAKQKVVSSTDTPGGKQQTAFLTEQGLYKVLMRSRKKIAEQFQDWVCEVVEQIRRKGKYDLQEKLQEKEKMIEQFQSELDKYKQTDYEQVHTTGYVYVMTTDRPNVFKIGTSKNVRNRAIKLQTANVDDIQVLFQFPTSNGKILEEAVHYVLDRYRTNSNREHFWADKDYIINVIKVLGNTMDTLKSCYHNIQDDKMMKRVVDNLLKEPVSRVTEQEYESNTTNVSQVVQAEPEPACVEDEEDQPFVVDEDFWEWLDHSIEYNQEKCVIKLIDIVNMYTGDYSFSKFNKQIMQHYKTQFQEYVRTKHPPVRWFQHTINYNGKTYKGWNNLKFV